MVAALFANANAFAATFSPEESLACGEAAMQALFNPADTNAGFVAPALEIAAPATTKAVSVTTAPVVRSPRQLLADFALKLRDIRYRRGGRAPSTGFDCSGFVHYVFAQVFGVDLPQNSAGQYQVGKQIARGDMKVGDLVFFKTHGKRISHVGIYLGEGRFIHSPTTGERVHVSNLAENYWARRFAGARRPNTLI